MFKNAALDEPYEPVIQTRAVSHAMAPEIDLPSMKQSFKSCLGRNQFLDEPLNIICHSKKPTYQSFLTSENDKGVLQTVPRHSSFRRKSMLSRFVDTEHSAKNHKEFISGQMSKPVGLYAIPAG